MTDLRTAQVVAQVVTQNTGGNQSRVTGLLAQMITAGTSAGARVSDVTLQVLNRGTPKGGRITHLTAQQVIQNLEDSGGIFRVASNANQVIYTTGAPDTDVQRAWTFDFDGHTFYVLDLGTVGALCYDLTTRSWSRWDTSGWDGHFNFKNGFHWRDGKSVIGGGLLDGLVSRIEEDTFIDEGFRPVTYEIQGVVFSTTERYLRQFALRLIGSPGRRPLDDDIDPPTLVMEYSDDNGGTWSNPMSITLNADLNQRIEFRSLGAFRQPGRIFRMYDNGGIKFVAYVMADVEGEEY